MRNDIPHAQIRRIMDNETKRNISKSSIIEVEKILVKKIKLMCEEAKRIMNYKKIITLFPDDLEYKIIGNIEETNKIFSFEPIKRIIRNTGIKRINPDSVKKIINKIVKLVKDLTREGDLFSQSEGMKTIKGDHIRHGSIFVDNLKGD